MIKAQNRKLEVESIDDGSYAARIYKMIHIGTVEGWNGKIQNKVNIGFELPTELHVFDEAKGPQPRVISAEFTLSFNEKATLRKVIDAIDPKALKLDDEGFVDEFDIETLIGRELLVTVKNEPSKDGSRMYANLANYTRLPKGMTCPELINPPQVLNYDNWDEDLFQKQPDFIKNKIIPSVEYREMKGIKVEHDDVPFN